MNSDWGYRIDFPAYLFDRPAEAGKRGGVDLTSTDGQARLFFFAGPSPGLDGPVEIADFLSKLDDVHLVTYRRVTSTWIVISGFIGEAGEAPGNIFYERLALARDYGVVSGFRLEYPETERARYDALIGRIGRSLTPPRRAEPASLADSNPAGPNHALVDGETRNRIGNTHVEWCRSRYRTYDSETDTFLRFDGIRFPCVEAKE